MAVFSALLFSFPAIEKNLCLNHPRPQGYPVFLNVMSRSRWPNGLAALGTRMLPQSNPFFCWACANRCNGNQLTCNTTLSCDWANDNPPLCQTSKLSQVATGVRHFSNRNWMHTKNCKFFCGHEHFNIWIKAKLVIFYWGNPVDRTKCRSSNYGENSYKPEQ